MQRKRAGMKNLTKLWGIIAIAAVIGFSLAGCGDSSNGDLTSPGTNTPGTNNPGTNTPGTDDPGTDNPGTDNPGTDQPGTDDPGTDQPGTDDPGTDHPGTDDPETDHPGTGDPGTDDPGTDDPGTDHPGTGDPGTDHPGTGDPGTDQPGTGDPSGGNETTVPDDPSNVQATADSAEAVTVTWSPATNATSYEISYSEQEESSANRTKTTTTATSITITGLKAHTWYHFEVIAINAAGRSPGYYGVDTTCWTKAEPFSITAEVKSSTSILISWTDVAWAENYALFRDSGFGYTRTIVEGASYLHTELKSGRTYSYYLEAKDKWGQTEKSNTVSITIVPTPTGLTAQAGIGISNQLSWTAVSGATGYKVEYQTGSSEWTPIQETITATSYTHSGLTEWTTYTYRIKAVMNSDESAYSAAVSRTVGPVPTGVSATAQSSSSISVSWNAVSGAISYKVYYRIGTYGALTQADLATTATSYTHTGLQANTTYWYYITALNSTRNESGYSSAVSATTSSSGSGGGTTTTKLATPTDLREFSDSQSSYVQISWAEVPLAYTYEVYRSTSANGSYSKITVSLGSGTGISSGREIATDSNPRSGTSYYKVRAIPNKTYYPNLAESDLSDYIRVDR